MFKLRIKNIASCLTCYSESEYVWVTDTLNISLLLVCIGLLVAFVLSVILISSVWYTTILFLVYSLLTGLVKSQMQFELRCKGCKKSLLI